LMILKSIWSRRRWKGRDISLYLITDRYIDGGVEG